MKRCCDCGALLGESEFYRYPNGLLNSYCRPCHNQRTKRWRDANPDKVRSQASKQAIVSREYRLEWRRRLRSEVIAIMGGRCVRCGFSDARALQIDHINGGGNAERLSLGSPNKLYGKIKREGSQGYQLLCANCNWIKRHENEEYKMNYRKQSSDAIKVTPTITCD